MCICVCISVRVCVLSVSFCKSHNHTSTFVYLEELVCAYQVINIGKYIVGLCICMKGMHLLHILISMK